MRGVVSKARFKPEAHWTPEKLSLSDQYPLSAELNKVMNPVVEVARKRSVNRPKAGVHLRNQIVSPDLCGMSSLKEIQFLARGR